MRIKLFIIAILLCTVPVFAQEYGGLNFINQLGEKKTATWGDATALYVITLGKAPAGFDANVQTLQSMGIIKTNKYGKDKPLRKGMLAKMIARHLKLKNTLLYLIFGTERYAHRSCVAERIYPADSSEWDAMRGDELIEIMTMVSEKMEKLK